MNLVAWLAFGAIAGYTAYHLGPVDPSIGPEGHALLAITVVAVVVREEASHRPARSRRRAV